MNENDLMNKLLISKKIMEKHQVMPRNSSDSGLLSSNSIDIPQIESFDTPSAKYNIPQEFMQENVSAKIPKYVNTSERIMSSKLPDAIKQLMIEHPIQQPNSMSGPTLSDELVEKASRLMKNGNNNQVNEVNYETQKKPQTNNNQDLKALLKEVVEEVLLENGILAESTTKSNEVFSFKVGKHIFEGKLLKVKKLR